MKESRREGMVEKKWAAEVAGRELSILKCRSNGEVLKTIQIIDMDLENTVQLAADLNELEAYQALGKPEELAAMLDERRWRVIGGKEWPKDGQTVTIGGIRKSDGKWVEQQAGHIDEDPPIRLRWKIGSFFWTNEEVLDDLWTHCRPAPTDVPKEENE